MIENNWVFKCKSCGNQQSVKEFWYRLPNKWADSKHCDRCKNAGKSEKASEGSKKSGK